MLPDHLPEIFNSILQWTLGYDKGISQTVPLRDRKKNKSDVNYIYELSLAHINKGSIDIAWHVIIS